MYVCAWGADLGLFVRVAVICVQAFVVVSISICLSCAFIVFRTVHIRVIIGRYRNRGILSEVE